MDGVCRFSFFLITSVLVAYDRIRFSTDNIAERIVNDVALTIRKYVVIARTAYLLTFGNGAGRVAWPPESIIN